MLNLRLTYAAARFLLPGLLLICLIGDPVATHGQQKPVPATVAQARDDHAPVRVRYPARDALRELQTNRDYQYNRDAPPPDNPVGRFFDWLIRKLAAFLVSKAYQNFWQYVFLAAIAGFVIYLLMKAEVLGFLFPRKAQSEALPYDNLAENIHLFDFDAAIEEAVGQRNFRLAVRLLYLQTLKHLTDLGQIRYKSDKTNRQYVDELADSPLQAGFEALTRQFEFVWYGDFPINEAQFGLMHQQFRAFAQATVGQLNPTN